MHVEKQISTNYIYIYIFARNRMWNYFLREIYLNGYFLLLLWICYPTGMSYFLRALCVSEYLIRENGIGFLDVNGLLTKQDPRLC